MKLLGLTGGIGMGKSAAADCLRQLGLPVTDTDTLARELVAPGQSALREIQRAFGDGVVDDAGVLRREELARIVFADDNRRRELEAILHPRIRAAWLAEAARWRERGCLAGGVVIPLLFETDAAWQFSATICVACTAASQQARLRARGWSEEQITQRIRAQWPIERKIAAARYVIWAEGGLANTAGQLARILRGVGVVP